MILPKGTLEFERTGGEKVVEELFDEVHEKGLTGYLLLIGRIQEEEGKDSDITGQLVFKEGRPVLCETVLNDTPKKGEKGVYDLLQGIMTEGNSIEIRTKIDVEPPIAFFKECSIEDEDINIPKFMEAFRLEAEERKEREEERKRREKQKQEWKEQVEEWVSSGYKIPSFPEVMDRDFNDIERWFTGLSQNVSRVKENLEWLRSIDEIEVQGLKEDLVETMKNVEEIKRIDESVSNFKNALDGVKEKRNEIQKWVNLWRDEGYNTKKIENVLSSDLETAWNAMTQFMDEIQKLKDAKDDLEIIKKKEDSGAFTAEIRDIEFLLNDPGELENIERLLTELKDEIEREKAEKESIRSEAEMIKERGLDISYVTGSFDLRSSELRERMNLLSNNSKRIMEIKKELQELDGKDIESDIEKFESELTDPLNLEEYEKGLLDLKDRIADIQKKRNAISKQIEEWRSQGVNVKGIEGEINTNIERLQTLLETFRSKVNELGELKKNISQMDHRWLEEEFEELESMLLDPSKLDLVKGRIKELADRIEERESKRAMVREDMEKWEKDGYNVEKLNAVIEDDDSVFMHIHRELKDNISKAEEMLKELNKLDTGLFSEKTAETKTKIMKLDDLDGSAELLEKLSADIDEDRKQREIFNREIDELKEQGWHTEGLKEITSSTPPDQLRKKIDGTKKKIEELKNALEEMKNWDPLETKWLQDSIEDLEDHLKRVMDHDNAIAKYEDISSMIEMNKQKRETIRNKLKEWKDIGYITKKVEELVEADVEKLSDEFDSLKDDIEKLEKLQATFDSLDIKHFKAEAEDIEFKLNDPEAVGELEKSIDELRNKIEEDKAKRDNYRQRIDDYLKEGFKNAKKLEEFLDEEITIVELEFDNFKKEVELFRKYMDKVGFSFKDAEEEKHEPVQEQRKNRSMKDLPLNENSTFGNFVSGSYNGIAHKAATEVAKDPGKDYNPLFIIGPMGLGKTHLLHAIANKIASRDEKKKVSYVTVEKFADDLERAMAKDNIEEFRDHYRSLDVLLIDDIFFISGREETQEELFNTFNALFENGKQIVIASDRHPKDIKKLANRLRSRFEGGVIVEMEQLDDDTKMKLIEKEADRINIKIPEEIVQNMSNMIQGTVRDIKGIVQSLGMKYKTEGKAPDDEMIKKIISERMESKEDKKLDDALGDMKDGVKG